MWEGATCVGLKRAATLPIGSCFAKPHYEPGSTGSNRHFHVLVMSLFPCQYRAASNEPQGVMVVWLNTFTSNPECVDKLQLMCCNGEL